MIRPRFIVAIALAIMFPAVPHASSNVISLHVPKAQKVGTGRLSFLFWDIYDATLYAPNALWQQSTPYALSISYLRGIDGKVIADSSRDEMLALGFSDEGKLEKWHRQMATIFPNVEKGTTLVGVRDESGQTIFYLNDALIGIITDTDFANWFFGIWLNEKTPKPRLRKRLLGSAEK